MNRPIAIAAAVAFAASLALPALGSASPRIAEGTEVFKGSMDSGGTIRFQALPSKRSDAPRLDRLRLKFDCRDGLGVTGVGAGAAPGSTIRPNSKRKFRISDGDSTYSFALRGQFNRRYTRAAGTFRFTGDIGDGFHTNCDSGRLEWQAKLQP